MKLFISLFLLLFSLLANANLIVIHSLENESRGKALREAFKNAYHIPDNWFLITDSENKKEGKIMTIWINKKGEPIEFSKNHKQIIALKILKKRNL